MGKRMLIDASHPEESRVAILNNDRLEEFDFETTTKKQLKGNIYLAKVIRIEPSLQAAFVEFGGNRHGFLAFNEIHPDYYRIPVEDRKTLLAQAAESSLASSEETPDESAPLEDVETLGGEDVVEEIQERTPRSLASRQYKIQEVIKRRQIMLVQVAKEERGGKGAALTTYLSLAGRYCVLMPNAAKGGGISRKITNIADRKRLREIIESIGLPDSMSLIIRTAGMTRNKTEIKRDCDYLMKLWNEIRENTLHSVAPSLIYEESNLLRRAIRDYYTRDIDEILIEGEEGYKEAKTFIRQLMPSHAAKVQKYDDEKNPLFYRYGVEQQIDIIHNPVIQLKSGGYIVFGTTEALIAIDVNSGKATRERHIEETAFKTNLEAAEEVARQLQLRDLAGLIVIDFIDMEEQRNIDAVERRLKDAMRHDRARVQVGRISPFGLLELSRQRLRPNIIESTSLPCQACGGTGMVRSVESSSLHVLRRIEEEAMQQKVKELLVYLPTSIILYLLNQKRKAVQDVETKWDIFIRFSQDDTLIPPHFRIERLRPRGEATSPKQPAVSGQEKEEREIAASSSQRKDHPRPRMDTLKKRRHPRRRSQSQEAAVPSLASEQREPKSQESITDQGAADFQSQADASKKTAPSGKSRKRYRKFDRKPHTNQGRAQETSSQKSTSSSSERKKEISSPASEKSEEKAADSSHPHPIERKKATARKGWWQRLLE